MSIKKKSQLSVVGLLEIMLVYLAFCFTTISQKINLFTCLAIMLFLLVSILYIMSNHVIYTCLELRGWAIQLHTINAVGVFLLIVLLLRDIQGVHFGGYQKWLLLLFLLTFTICEGIYVRKNIWKKWKDAVSCICIYLKRNLGVICILLIFALLSVHTGGNSYNWDSRLYYTSCQNLDAFSISSLAIYGHIAQTFGMLMKLGTVIFGSVGAAAYLVNVFLAMAAILSFYGILQYVCRDSGKMEVLFATGVYAFSPYLLGLVNYLNLDHYCACLFPLVVYSALKEKWIYHIVIAIMFVFTKEPAIVIYAGFCVGYFACREYNRFKDAKKINLLGVFLTNQYWYMILIACLWFTTYKLLGPWSAGNGGVQFDISYIQQKLKVMFILNFSWIIFGLCIIALVVFWRYVYKKYGFLFWSIITSILFFVVFSCMFKTISHYRYNDVLFFSLWLLAAPFCLSIKSKWMKNSILVGLLGIMLSASYTTIDPVSDFCFGTVYTGNGKVWTISASKHFGDAIIYNKQGLNVEVAMNRTLTDVIEEDDVIILQAKYNNPWMIDGFSDFAILNDNNRKSVFFWDEQSKKRDLIEHSGDSLVEMNHVSTLEDLDKLVSEQGKENIYSYITIYQDEESLAEEIANSYRVLECDTYQYQNWKLERVRFKKQ